MPERRPGPRILLRPVRLLMMLGVVAGIGLVAGLAAGPAAGAALAAIYFVSWLVLPIVRLRVRLGRGTGLGVVPGKPRRSPPAQVDDELPKLVWVLRNREPARARMVLMEGALLQRENVYATTPLAIWLSAALVRTAVGATPAEDDLAQLADQIVDIAPELPFEVESEVLQRWQDQLRGHKRSYQFTQPLDFTVTHLAAIAVVGAGAATMAGLSRDRIYALYGEVRDAWGRQSPAKKRPTP